MRPLISRRKWKCGCRLWKLFLKKLYVAYSSGYPQATSGPEATSEYVFFFAMSALLYRILHYRTALRITKPPREIELFVYCFLLHSFCLSLPKLQLFNRLLKSIWHILVLKCGPIEWPWVKCLIWKPDLSSELREVHHCVYQLDPTPLVALESLLSEWSNQSHHEFFVCTVVSSRNYSRRVHRLIRIQPHMLCFVCLQASGSDKNFYSVFSLFEWSFSAQHVYWWVWQVWTYFEKKNLTFRGKRRTLSAPGTCPEASSGSAEYFMTAQFLFQRSEQINWQFHLCTWSVHCSILDIIHIWTSTQQSHGCGGEAWPESTRPSSARKSLDLWRLEEILAVRSQFCSGLDLFQNKQGDLSEEAANNEA